MCEAAVLSATIKYIDKGGGQERNLSSWLYLGGTKDMKKAGKITDFVLLI